MKNKKTSSTDYCIQASQTHIHTAQNDFKIALIQAPPEIIAQMEPHSVSLPSKMFPMNFCYHIYPSLLEIYFKTMGENNIAFSFPYYYFFQKPAFYMLMQRTTLL